MGIGTGIAKQLRYRQESAYGIAPGASGAQLLRRVTSSIDLSKDTFQSNELRSDYQIADFRHGTRRVAGSINGELSPRTYGDFIAAALRRAFTNGAAITGLTITIATGSVINGVQTYTATRSAGSYLTDGVKIGKVVALTAGSFNAANANKNLLVIALTATIATVVVLNGSLLVAEGPIATATLTVRGRETFTPTAGHTDLSFAVEHWFADVPTSELFLGCKVNTLALALPPTGISTIEMGLIGQNITTNTTAYYTSPTAPTSTGVMAAVNGALIVGGSPIGICTGLSINVAGGYTGDPVVGTNAIPNVFPGRVNISGSFTAYFDSGSYRDNFVNEDEIGLIVALSTGSGALADFIALSLPRIKLGGATKSDGEQGIVATFPFQALFNAAGGAGVATEQTTLGYQES